MSKKIKFKNKNSKLVLSEVEGLWNCRKAAMTSLILGFGFCILNFNVSRLQADSRDKPLELIAVPEEEKWLVLVAAPIAAQIKQKQKTPVVIVLSSEQPEKQRWLLAQLNLVANSCSVLSQDQNKDLFGVSGELPVRVRAVRPNLTQASILFAKSFWKRANTVVMASTRKPEVGILASTLAAHLRVPFIPFEAAADLRGLSKDLDSLGVATVLFGIESGDANQIEISSIRQKVEFLDGTSLSSRIIELLGASNIRNLILARVPQPETGVGAQSWIGPYLSVMRGAAVVLCSSADGTSAEEQVKDFITRHSLRPCTITILADYDSIGAITIKDSENLGDYEVYVEPCSRPLQGDAAAVGVGRIPLRGLWACSTAVACGIAREFIPSTSSGQALGQNQPHVLMVANPNAQYGSLPLAETVSRATSEEFKNFGITISEFYSVPLNNPQILEAATKANLIIYEGHLYDQLLFQDPSNIIEPEDEYSEEWSATNGSDESTTDSILDEHPRSNRGESSIENRGAGIERLEGLPLIVLQSCHSLEEAVAQQIFSLGGIGLIGSVSNIYSASGSAFIKAFCDGLLYRGDTVGEALRDARNYFLCLHQLKCKRGHTQTAAVYRAALGFCLWGDPELRITAGVTRKPRLKPILARYIASDKISISTPERRLPELQTEKYFVRMFPASQLAGIVKRSKTSPAPRLRGDKLAPAEAGGGFDPVQARAEPWTGSKPTSSAALPRQLMPIYFFRLPIPRGFNAQQYTNLQRQGDTPNRAVFMTEPFERFLYVLYFPEKEIKDDKFELQFTK